MSERRTIGDILVESGRITRRDVERALEYQREHGGYFGQALVELGLVTREELDWGLASQFDLPYVFPNPESIDPEAAALVTPEWALSHMALPIMKVGDTLTVVVDFPMRTDAIEELEARTDLKVDLALASPSAIRELIRKVYARPPAPGEEEVRAPITLKELFAHALDAGSPRFGISVRDGEALGWYEEEGGPVRRRPLEGLWDQELNGLVTPSPAERTEEGARSATWVASVSREGVVSQVDVRYLLGDGGAEYLFEPRRERTAPHARFEGMSAGIISEIRLLARSGAAQFVVVAEPPELGHRVIPHLPALTLDPSWRSVYVTDRGEEPAPDVFTVSVGPEEKALERLRELHPFRFDVLSADLGGSPREWVAEALEVARVVFLLAGDEEALREIEGAGVRWELRVKEGVGTRLHWTLQPIHR